MPVPLDACLGLRSGTGLEARASRNQPGSSFTAMPYGVGKVIPQLARGSSLPNGENDDRPAFPMGFGMALQRYLATVIHNPSEPFQTVTPTRGARTHKPCSPCGIRGNKRFRGLLLLNQSRVSDRSHFWQVYCNGPSDLHPRSRLSEPNLCRRGKLRAHFSYRGTLP